jgi:hypothetical protein
MWSITAFSDKLLRNAHLFRVHERRSILMVIILTNTDQKNTGRVNVTCSITFQIHQIPTETQDAITDKVH